MVTVYLPEIGDSVIYVVPEDVGPTQVLVYRLEGEGVNEFVDFGQHSMEDMATVGDQPEVTPEINRLHDAVPNPARPGATIRYSIGKTEHVLLRVFDVEGRYVKTLVDEVKQPGGFEASWDGTNAAGEPVTSGVYFYQLETPGFASAKKSVVLK